MTSNSPGRNLSSETSYISRGPRMTFLLIFIVMTSVGSMFVLIAVVHNRRHRTVQNVLIANMSVVCLIDCFLNMTLVLGTLITDEWTYGSFMCSVNGLFMNFVTTESLLILMSLTINRFLALRFPLKYETWLQPCKLSMALVYVWLHGIVVSIPFLTDSVNTTFRPELHYCSTSWGTSNVFFCIALLFSFIIPFIVVMIFQSIVLKLSYQLRYTKSADNTKKTYTQMGRDTPSVSMMSSHPSSYITILLLSWIIFSAPTTISSYINKHNERDNYVSHFPWIVDAVFLWMRFFFSAIFPYVTFYCTKDLWQAIKERILCRKHNSVVDMEVVRIVSVTNVKNKKIQTSLDELARPKVKEKEKTTSTSNNFLAFNIPVLFATSTGICIEDPYFGDTITQSVLSEKDFAKSVKGKKLDISYSEQGWQDELVGDTSDYDSSYEIDQYSTSQPVSSRNIHGTLHRSRCLSDPEISKNALPSKSNGQSLHFSGSSRTDSGLDLSATSSSNITRSSKTHTMKIESIQHVKMANLVHACPGKATRCDVTAQTDYSSSLASTHQKTCVADDSEVTHKQSTPGPSFQSETNRLKSQPIHDLENESKGKNLNMKKRDESSGTNSNDLPMEILNISPSVPSDISTKTNIADHSQRKPEYGGDI